MLSVSFGGNAGYLTKHVEEHRSKDRGNYYLTAAEHGEPPGEWWGPGAEALGLTGTVDAQQMLILYNKLVDPTTGEQLGRKPYQYADAPERLAAAIAAEGGDVLPERERELSLSISKTHREARNYADLTFSMPKSWSVFHASLERAGRLEDASQVWEAAMDGVHAGVEYLKENAGYSRAGRHGVEAGGRTSGRWVEGKNWVASTWRHHTSRDGDPQLHVHVAVLNRVQCEDGKWRTLDSRAIYRARPAAGAISERVAEESLAKRLGVEFLSRADGVGREIVGITDKTRDLFSSRRRAITEEVAKRVETYEQTYGHAPNAYTLRLMSEQATLVTRIRKPEHPPTREELLDDWEARTRQHLGQALDEVAEAVQTGGELEATPFEPEAVIARALEGVQESKSVWTRHDLVSSINKELPDCLGGLSASQVSTVVDELTETALEPGGDVVKLTAPELVPAPAELRRADGRSVYEPPTAERYTTIAHLSLEEAIVHEARRSESARLERETAERLVAASSMSEHQGAAVLDMLTSGRNVETFIGAPGVGKTFTMSELARLWHEGTGRTVVGLTTSEAARQVLEAEGFEHSFNITKWQVERRSSARQLAAARRLLDDLNAATSPLTPKQHALSAQLDQRLLGRPGVDLNPGDLVVVDEASMVTTADLHDVVLAAQQAGAKIVLTGDDGQLGAVGAGGMLRLLGQEPSAVRLETPIRFSNEWEAAASLQLRRGDVDVLGEYERHGRIEHGDKDSMLARARDNFVADTLAGKRSVIVVPTNELAAQLSSNVRSRLVDLGRVAPEGVELHNATTAGVGDIVATRKNDRQSNSEKVVNRETYRVAAVMDDGRLVVQRFGVDGVLQPRAVTLAADYVAEHVELAYAATTHSVQGRTVERAHDLVDERSSREALTVGMTRGSQLNVAYVITIDHDTEMPVAELDPVSVLAQIMERDDSQRSAIEVQRDELAAAESLARLEPMWADVVGAANVTRYSEQLRERLSAELFEAVETDEALASFYRELRTQELAGADIDQVLDTVTAGDLTSARSPASVLDWRLQQQAGERQVATSYVGRTPAPADEAGRWALDLADAMDRRVGELGEIAAAEQPGWAAELGPLPDDPTDRADWTERAGAIAAYREAHGYRGDDAIGAAPPRGAVEARASWDRAYDALGRPERHRDVAEASDAQLERMQLSWQREQEWAPANVDEQLQRTWEGVRHWETAAAITQAEAEQVDDAVQRSTSLAAAAQHEQVAELLRDTAAKLQTIADAREAWYGETAEVRERARLADREQHRRQRHQGEASNGAHPAPQPGVDGIRQDPVPEREIDEGRSNAEPAERAAVGSLGSDIDIDAELARAAAARSIIEERHRHERSEQEASLQRSTEVVRTQSELDHERNHERRS